MIRIVGALVGRAERAEALVAELERGLAGVRARAAQLAVRPRVFFEEWDAPLISGIRWVEELVEIAGGEPIFPELRDAKLGKDRIVDADEVARRAPDVIVASWCGKAVRKERIRDAAGVAGRARRPARSDLRDQVRADPAARPGGADRRAAPAARRDQRRRGYLRRPVGGAFNPRGVRNRSISWWVGALDGSGRRSSDSSLVIRTIGGASA